MKGAPNETRTQKLCYVQNLCFTALVEYMLLSLEQVAPTWTYIKQTLASYLTNHPSKTKPDMLGTDGENKYELISKVLSWTPIHGHNTSGWPVENYIHHFYAGTGCSLEDLPGSKRTFKKVIQIWMTFLVNELQLRHLHHPCLWTCPMLAVCFQSSLKCLRFQMIENMPESWTRFFKITQKKMLGTVYR